MIRAALQRLSRHTLVYATAEQLGRLAGFLLLPLTTGFLGESDFGTRELLATMITLLAQLAGINISAAMSRFYFEAKDAQERRRVISTSVLTVAATATSLGLLAFSTADWWAGFLPADSEGMPTLARLGVAIFACQVIREVQNKVLQTEERSTLYGALSVAKLVVEISLQILFLVHLRAGLLGLLWAILIAEASFALINAVILLPKFGLGFSTSIFTALFAYSLPLIPNGLLQFGLHSSDRYFVGALAGGEALGLYALAYKLGYMPNYLVLGPFLLIWYPFVFSLPDRDTQRRMVARLAPYFMLALTAASLGVALLAQPLVQAATSRVGFHRAWTSVPFISFGYWLWGLFQILQTGFYVAKSTRTLPVLTLGAFVTNAFLNLTLIPALGFLGAAVATMLTFGTLCWVCAERARDVFDVDYPWKRIVGPAALAVAIVVAHRAINWLYFGIEPTVASVILWVVWLASACFFGLTRTERTSCLSFVRGLSRGSRGPKSSDNR